MNLRLFSVTAYREPSKDTEAQAVNCDYTDQPENSERVCKVDVSNWTPCVKESKYNYDKGAPCIFLKLNKVSLYS